MRVTRATVTAITAVLLTVLVTATMVGFSSAGAASSVPLENTTWRLSQLNLAGSLTPVSGDVVSTLRLDAGQATGSAACNAFFGRYETSGDSLTFGPIGSTQLACPDPS